MSHDLYTDADPARPDVICDSNGQVTLSLCKRCGKGEAELYADDGSPSPCYARVTDFSDKMDALKANPPPKWENNRMNPWTPDNNPHQARRIGKTLEEAGELVSVLGRISIQGMDSVDPSSGKTNRQRLLDETADLYAQCDINMDTLFTKDERVYVWDRALHKRRQMAEWGEHYKPNPATDERDWNG